MPTPDELEDAAARNATASLRARLEDITARGLALYESMAPEELAGPGPRAMVRNLLANQLSDLANGSEVDAVSSTLRTAVQEAMHLSAADAARSLGVAQQQVTPSTDLIRITLAAADSARDELRLAAGRMASAEDSSDVLDALTSARRAVTRSEAAARFAVNRALSEGATNTAERNNASRLWIPERDACVHCLAYAGEVAGPGESFRGGLTFGRKPLVPTSEDVPNAPLHPNCRCRVVVYRPEWDEGSGVVSRPEALKREALRSVLRGFSMESESPKVRLDAAERALKRAGNMPKSVQDYAARAIRKGAFPRGRDFPRSAKIELRKTPDRLSVPEKKTDPFDALPRKKAGERSTAALDVKATNPRFSEGEQWQVNCQRAVVAFELRRRGFDVTSRPNDQRTDKQYTQEDLRQLWRTETGDVPSWLRVDEGRHVPLALTSMPPGARGWIAGTWGDRYPAAGHIWSWLVTPKGELVFIDPQSGAVQGRAKANLERLARGTIYMLRTDDLIPTSEVIGMVEPVVSP